MYLMFLSLFFFWGHVNLWVFSASTGGLRERGGACRLARNKDTKGGVGRRGDPGEEEDEKTLVVDLRASDVI
jgi:hypothetical protein